MTLLILLFPVTFRIGPLEISLHAVLEALAYAGGFQLYRVLRRRSGDFLADPNRTAVIAAAIAGAAIGSKLLYWTEDPGATWQQWRDPYYLMGGKTIVGGLLGGTLAVEWIKRRLGIVRRTGDLFAVPIAVAIAIGRAGCFFQGLSDHTYGTATALPWGVDFGDGVRRHPTQLYESLFCLALAAVLSRLRRRPHREGDLFRIFLVSYLGLRVAIDFWKPGVPIFGMTSLQWASLADIIAYWRDVLRWCAPKGGAAWATGCGPTCITTPPSLSAPPAFGAPTARSSSRTETSTS